MKGIISGFLVVLDYFDIFHFPVTLVLNKKETATTITGKIISSIIIAFVLYSFAVSDLINRTNAQTLSQDLSIKPRFPLYFTSQNFTVAIGVSDVDNNFVIDETIFSIDSGIYFKNNQNQWIDQNSSTLKPCTKADFKEDSSDFENLGLNGTLCLSFESFELSGFWDENTVSYLWIEMAICRNDSETKVICKSPEAIETFLNSKYFNAYFTKNSIDASDYSNPISRSLKVFYKRINVEMCKTMSLNFKKGVIRTDFGFFFQSISEITTYLIGDVEYDISSNVEDGVVFALTVYASDQLTLITRKYQNIQDLLAQIGGICNFIIYFGYILTKIENQYNFISKVSNELFIFEKTSSFPEKQTRSKNESESNRSKSEKLTPGIFVTKAFKTFLSKIKYTKEINSMASFQNEKIMENLDEYRKTKQKENCFQLGFIHFLKLVLIKKKKWKLNNEESLFVKAEEQITRELDLLKIMQKLQDLEKLKRILLSDEQIYLFNLLSKPMISLGENSNDHKNKCVEIKFPLGRKMTFDKDKILRIYEAAQQRAAQSPIDKRILKLLDEDVKIFLNSKNMSKKR